MMKRGNILKKTKIIQGLATVTILAGMAMPMMVQAQEGGQVPQIVKADFFQRASANSIINAPNASVVTPDDEAGSKYSFIAKFIKGVTTVETGGDGWTNDVYVNMPPQKWDGKIGLDVTKTKKGQSWIRYNNVGTADDGTPIDLKITIQDWEQYKNAQNMVSNNIVAFNNVSAIATYQGGFSWVKQTWTYLEHGTDKEKPVSGYYSWIDVDNLQGMTIDKDSYKAIDKLYVPTKDTIIKYKEEKDGGKTFYDSDDIPLDDGDNRGDFTFLYSNRSRFDFTYSEDFATREKNSGNPLPPKNNNQYSYFGYSAKKPVRTAPMIPTKTVTDSDETNVDILKLWERAGTKDDPIEQVGRKTSAMNWYKRLTTGNGSANIGGGKIDVLEAVLGQTINGGQCYGLTALYVEKMGGPVLMGSGHMYASQIGSDYDWKNYHWTVIQNPKYEDLKAGDVINFGQGGVAISEFGHTGIVASVEGNGKYTTYEQNAEKGQTAEKYLRQWQKDFPITTSLVRKDVK